ncbi:hypothetical protein AHT39_001893 [Salmonella enterica subsp. enterica serovar Isangi]|uniref:hypothetical protein n=1 Tax=Salmonella enterica TaxID=28901 RepID=UPI00107ABB15|nr:hypothetical protein [Salmonella enterica]EBF6654651.1 hypothetical protein [Salmonella enterica subsp. enterica serovar Infantis]EBS0090855.1 hypothetical protein [Salmonella enterica subsp. enterica serovar Tennessee]EBW1710887.1 hypothetical protein [Salmonella enterica subsp. enterica serovar Livingstone]EBW2699276.1 hypothetical protein [Salmonella enterica subsp. enterica serovar Galiema]EBZ5858819.1 hypothetical protein [Salmonella enterica subsp. enterica serovar Amersfoort]ECC3197
MECNISELVKSGHERAAELKASCCAVDVRSVAQLIRDLASQLEVQLVRSNTLAAENAGLKKSEAEFNAYCREECERDGYTWEDDFTETPATDAFLAEVRAQGRNEGINYAASRLAAAYNHGFIGKSMSEVADVVHMILDTKEELANSTLPAADGLSGEYAEEFLEDSAAQLRKGDAQ